MAGGGRPHGVATAHEKSHFAVRHTQTLTHTETHTDTHGHTDTHTDTQTDRHTHTLASIPTYSVKMTEYKNC